MSTNCDYQSLPLIPEEHSSCNIIAGRRGGTVLESLMREQVYGDREECPEVALHDAALGDMRSLANHLVTQGADVNAIGGIYESPLGAAIFAGHQEMVKWLLQHGARVNMKTTLLGTPLHAATLFDRLEIASLLIAHGASVNAQAGVYGTALQLAAIEGNTSMVELLLACGADVNGEGGKHGNALTAAATVLGLILPAGSLKNERDVDSWLARNENHLKATVLTSHAHVVLQLVNAVRESLNKGHTAQS